MRAANEVLDQTTKMRPVVKPLWTQALRSGRYRQGRAALHSSGSGGNDEFCCFGVLCDVAVHEGVVTSSLLGDVHAYGPDEAVYWLPHEVLDWAFEPWPPDCLSFSLEQLKDSGHGELVRTKFGNSLPGSRVTLVYLNDQAAMPFPAIADLIEKWM
jgi:hypothetical protein